MNSSPSPIALEVARSQSLVQDYLQSPRAADDCAPVLEAYRASRFPFVWEEAAGQSGDAQLFSRINLENMHIQATAALEDFQAAPEDAPAVVLKLIGLNALSASGISAQDVDDPSPASLERLAVWQEVLSAVPEFATGLELARETLRCIRIRVLTVHPDAYSSPKM